MILHNLPLLTPYKMLNGPEVSDISLDACENSYFPNPMIHSVKSGSTNINEQLKNSQDFQNLQTPNPQKTPPPPL